MHLNFSKVDNGTIQLNFAISGSGPLILFIHGFPGFWYSWRHAISYFSSRGYQVAAMDVRGFGKSSKPLAVESYKLRDLVSDAVAIIESLEKESAIIVGDDWGAVIAWHLALLSPKRVKAVAGLSVPYVPPGPLSFLDLARSAYRGKFFYQIFFQNVGKAEERLEFNIEDTLRHFLFSTNNISELNKWLLSEPRNNSGSTLPCPDWMKQDELDVFVETFSDSGFSGPLNRYRAQQLDVSDLQSWRGSLIEQPSFFIGGQDDPFRYSLPGYDLFKAPGQYCRDFRGHVIIPKIGHWVQQEAPDIVHHHLMNFFASVYR